jgi:hypothetical protein
LPHATIVTVPLNPYRLSVFNLHGDGTTDGAHAADTILDFFHGVHPVVFIPTRSNNRRPRLINKTDTTIQQKITLFFGPPRSRQILPGRGHRLGKKTFYQSNRNVAQYAIKKFQLPLQAKLNKNSKNKQKYLKLLG